LQNSPLAALVSEEILAAVIPDIERISVAEEEVVIREGDPGDSMVLLHKGRLKVIARDSEGNEIILNYLEPGRTAGEISLLTGERRTATVAAAEASDLLRFTRAQFQVLQERFPDEMELVTQRIMQRLQQAHLSSALYSSRLLGDLEDKVLHDLETEVELQLLSGGDVVVRQGEESDSLYIVISGRLRVVHGYGTDEEKTVFEMGRGQTVGEMGLITEAKRTATVYALRDSLVARLSRESFDRLLAKHPNAVMRQFAGKVIQILEEEVKGTARIKGNVGTFTLIPVQHELGIGSFADRLAAALERIGPTVALDSQCVEDALGRPGISQTMVDSPANISMVRWLSEQEMRHRFVLYVADPVNTNWTRRSLRQADRVLLVADAGRSPELGAVERAPRSSKVFHTENTLILVHPPDTDLPSNTASWLVERQVEQVYHVRQDNAADFGRLARLLTGRGIGVVMSGGGARGIAHLGAAKRLEELGIPADAVGGSSAGGIMSCLWASSQGYESILNRMGDIVARNLKDYTFPAISLMAGFRMTDQSKAFFGEDRGLEDLWIPCFVTTANISSSRLMVHDRGPIWKYLRGTSSVPGVFPPVMENGEMLVDGGLINNLPTDVMSQRPDIGTVIALDVSGSQDPPFEKDPYVSSLNGWKVLWSRINPFSKPQEVPGIARVMMGVAMISSGAAIELTRNLADFYARLDPGAIGLFEFDAYRKSAENGYRSATEIIATWEEDEKFQALKEMCRLD
jgi:predicted acylesterase/phospholipase RssA/CRP-like cAMP-binding protein